MGLSRPEFQGRAFGILGSGFRVQDLGPWRHDIQMKHVKGTGLKAQSF